jgi:uncharacterized membrane protein YidH (DUF202 family)
MTARRPAPLAARAFAVVGLGVTVVAAVAAVIWRLLDPAPIVQNTFGFGDLSLVSFGVLGITFAAVGAILTVRVPSNAVGWIMVIIGISYAMSALTAAITFSAIADGPAAAGTAALAAWFAVLFSTIGGLVFVLGFIFPTGRGHTLRWDRFVRASVVALPIMVTVGLILRPGPLQVFPSIDNPFGYGPDLRPIFGAQPSAQIAGFLLLFMPVLTWSIVSRYRLSDTVGRQQLKWFVASLAIAVGGIGFAALTARFTDRPPEAGLALFGFAGALIPIAIGVAILRYGLYDIDRIISRTLAYVIITGLLVGTYVGMVVLVGGPIASLTGGGDTLSVALSTLAVAALFQPVRTRVQTVVDRRFDRARYDGEQTVAAFAGRLRADTDLATISDDVTRTADTVMRPTSAVLWLRRATR